MTGATELRLAGQYYEWSLTLKSAETIIDLGEGARRQFTQFWPLCCRLERHTPPLLAPFVARVSLSLVLQIFPR